MMDTNNRIDAARLLPVADRPRARVRAARGPRCWLRAAKTAAIARASARACATLLALSQNIPLQARRGARRRRHSMRSPTPVATEQTLKSSERTARPAGPDDRFGDQAGWTELLEQSQAVLDGRERRSSAQQAAAERARADAAAAREHWQPVRAASARPELENESPRSSVSSSGAAPAAGPRGARGGASPVEAAARRLADGLDYHGPGGAGLCGRIAGLVIDAVRCPAGAAQGPGDDVRG